MLVKHYLPVPFFFTCRETGAYLGIKDTFNRKYLEEKFQVNLASNKKKLTKRLIKQLKQVSNKEPELFINKAVLEEKNITTQMLLDALRKPPPHKKFELHILPPYRSNLNPIERVWEVMNENVRDNVVFSSFKEFKTAILNFFDNKWNDISNGLRKRINDHFENLNPAF